MCSFKPSSVLVKNTHKKYYPQVTGNKSCDTLEKYARKAYPKIAYFVECGEGKYVRHEKCPLNLLFQMSYMRKAKDKKIMK